MIEPRARVVSFEDADFGDMRIQVIKASTAFPELLANGTELTTVADVLAALRQPSEAMRLAGYLAIQEHYRADGGWCGLKAAQEQMTLTWNAMLDQFELDQFERDQRSAT